MTPEEQKMRQEQAMRDADAAMVSEIEARVTDRASLLKHCLEALVVAGVPLDMLTASVLHELGTHLANVITEIYESEGVRE